MTWGTEFHTDIFITRTAFSTVGEVDDRIKELKEYIADRQARIKMFAAATPKDIIPHDHDPVHYVSREIDEELTLLNEDTRELYQIELFREHLQQTGREPSEFTE